MKRSCQRQTAVLLTAGGAHDLDRAQPVGRAEHDPRSPDVLLRAVAVIDDRLKAAAIGRAQLDGDACAHHPDSHAATGQGIPNRTHPSASIH